MTNSRHNLAETPISVFLLEIKLSINQFESLDENHRKNPNYPSALDYARSLLYRSHNLGVRIPEEPLEDAYSIHDYILSQLSSLKQSRPSMKVFHNLEETLRTHRIKEKQQKGSSLEIGDYAQSQPKYKRGCGLAAGFQSEESKKRFLNMVERFGQIDESDQPLLGGKRH